MIFFIRPIKTTLTYTVVYRKTILCHLNITFLHKVLCKVILKGIKGFFYGKVKNEWYAEKDIFEKVGKRPLNITFILNFWLQNGIIVSKEII